MVVLATQHQVVVPFVTILHSASANGFCGQFVKACCKQLLHGCLVAKNEACDSGAGGKAKGSMAGCR